MKIEKLFSNCAAVALVLGLATSAEAEIVTATYKGVVNDGYDQTGVFGTAGANLAGDSFTVVYTINDAVLAYSVNDPGRQSLIYGGSDVVHYNQSPVSAVVTINGVAVSIAGTENGLAVQYTIIPEPDQIYHYAATDERSFYVWNSVTSATDKFLSTSDYHAPLSHTIQRSDGATGRFYEDINDGGSVQSAYATLIPTSVTIVDVAVPEPTTWAMLILGMAMIGLAARRRTVGVAAAV